MRKKDPNKVERKVEERTTMWKQRKTFKELELIFKHIHETIRSYEKRFRGNKFDINSL
jgi:hypothetical protein